MKLSCVLLVVCCLLSVVSAETSQAVRLPSGDEYVAGQVIVKLDSRFRGIAPDKLPGMVEVCRRWNVSRFEPIVRGRRWAGTESGADLLYLVSFDPETDVRSAVAEFGACPGVAYACPNALIPVPGPRDETPDDPRYTEQWYLSRIRAPQAWDISHGDSSVVLAVIDDGLRYDHVDIAANVWVNRVEDINHNGRLDLSAPPAGDLDGIDQDSNGYADDVIGYDFLDSDPNPNEGSSDEHGTHGWGVANAVTDNDLGISAPAWNVRGMALRCGGGGGISMAASIAAIYYSVDKGAWVVSMGWGTLTPYAPLGTACADAWTAGSLPVASAGSASGTDPMYPGAFPNVVAVAACDQDDMRALFTGYGSWVDLSAPGIDILSTTGTSSYTLWSGTAGATQLTAGVLCWLKSAHPEVTNELALTMLLDLCDSMPDPLYAQGLLGAGRLAMVPDSLTLIQEGKTEPVILSQRGATILHGVLMLAQSTSDKAQVTGLVDISGRKVLDLHPGANDISRLSPGVYFVRSAERGQRSTEKVVIQR